MQWAAWQRDSQPPGCQEGPRPCPRPPEGAANGWRPRAPASSSAPRPAAAGPPGHHPCPRDTGGTESLSSRPSPAGKGYLSFPSWNPTGARPAMPSSAAREPSRAPSCPESPGEERSPQKGRLAQLGAHLAEAPGPSLDMRPPALPLLPAPPPPARGSSCSLLLGVLARILPPSTHCGLRESGASPSCGSRRWRRLRGGWERGGSQSELHTGGSPSRSPHSVPPG